MKRLYSFVEVERKWQTYWAARPVDKRSGPKYYCLSMFPYPSGNLHLGHVRVYSIADVMSRYQHLCGRHVLNPMGWDSFGLPAENAAIERGIDPAHWTASNVAQMRQEMDRLGFSFDWSHELWTCKPEYYKWTQELFLALHRKGLVYKQEALINWDPVDNTVLANEQVDEHGLSWRSGALVERRTMNQWFLKITEYADALLQGLNSVDWPDSVKEMQKGWIGKSDGLAIQFPLSSSKSVLAFTTKPETLMGVTFIAIAPENPVLKQLNLTEVESAAIETMQRAPEIERKQSYSGLLLHSVKATHPVTQQPLPVVVAEYVLPGYATGAVMGVPAHDERDQKLAASLGLPSVSVLSKNILVNSGQFDGLTVNDARREIGEFLVQHRLGEAYVGYRLKDWLVSRQRHWGCPIPMISCENCGQVESEPVELPLPHTKTEWLRTQCPQCGGEAIRESDTLDTFVDSAWYFLRFTDPRNAHALCSSVLANYWMPVDLYIGGTEHAIMHLLYARFIHKFLKDEGIVACEEPFAKLLTQGLVMGLTYKKEGKYLTPEEAALVEHQVSFEKMSKSKHNGVAPGQLLQEAGVDALRLALLFAAPSESNIEWDGKLLKTFGRWLQQIADLSSEVTPEQPTSVTTFKLMAAVTHSVSQHKLHVAVARLKECLDSLKKCKSQQGFEAFLVQLFPFAPHLSSELFYKLSHSDVRDSEWPCQSILVHTPQYTRQQFIATALLKTPESLEKYLKEAKLMKTGQSMKLDGAAVHIT